MLFRSKYLYLDTTPKYYYYQRSNSIAHTEFNHKTLGIITAVNEYVDFCNQNNLLSSKVKIGQIRWMLVVLNKMIISNVVDDKLKRQISKEIKRVLISIIFCTYLNFTRKMQMVIFLLSFKLYKKIYLKKKEKNT